MKCNVNSTQKTINIEKSLFELILGIM